MKVNKFSLTYLAGMVMILISGCFPFLGYQFTMKDYQDVKEWFPLLNLKKACRPLSGDGRYQSVCPDIALSGNPYRDSGNCTGCDLSAWRPGYLGHLQSDVFYTGCSFRY